MANQNKKVRSTNDLPFEVKREGNHLIIFEKPRSGTKGLKLEEFRRNVRKVRVSLYSTSAENEFNSVIVNGNPDELRNELNEYFETLKASAT